VRGASRCWSPSWALLVTDEPLIDELLQGVPPHVIDPTR
jgi:hypothetical protein